MKSRTQRKLFIVVVLAGITLAGFLTYRALQENLLYFFSPSQVAAGEAPNRTFRLGGMVLAGSLKREVGTLNVRLSSPITSTPSRSSTTACFPTCFAKARAP